MEKAITRPCGYALWGANDDEVVERAQRHAKTVHAMDLDVGTGVGDGGAGVRRFTTRGVVVGL